MRVVSSATVVVFLLTRCSRAQDLGPTLSPAVRFADGLDGTDENIESTTPPPANDTDLQNDSTEIPRTPSTSAASVLQTATPTVTPAALETPMPVSVTSVVGELPLRLMNTPSLLIGQVEIDFLNAVSVFITSNVQAALGNDSLDIVQIGLLRQFRDPRRRVRFEEHDASLRSLQALAPLNVEVRVVGRYSSRRGPELNFETLLKTLFDDHPEDFVAAIQGISDDSFFSDLVDVAVAASDEDTDRPVGQPSERPAVPPSHSNLSGNNTPASSSKDDFWSIGVIVGIAAGGAVFLIILCAILCRICSGKPANHNALSNLAASKSGSSEGYETNDTKATSAGESYGIDASRSKFWSRKPRAGSGEGDSTTKDVPLQDLGSDLESQGLYSYIKTDSESVMGGSVMYNNSVIGMDNMSYAYSLEPGVEASLAPESFPGDQSTMQDDSILPMEIPQITVPKKKGSRRGRRLAADGSPSGGQVVEREFSQEKPLSPSELRLTESELAMLPSNLRDSYSGEDDPHTSPAPAPPSPPTRVVVAPSGKLGLVIDTTIEGPIVHHVNEGSALKGKIFPGDIIVAIDNVDTRAMSASAITGLMVKTAKQKRRLTVLDGRAAQIDTKSKTKKSKNGQI